MKINERLLSRALTVLVVLVFIVYVLVLLKITVVKGTSLARIAENLASGRAPLRSVNSAPFDTIVTYLGHRGNMPFLRWFSNIFGNVLVFVPLGLYLPMVIPAMRTFLRTLTAAVLASMTLEALQYLLGTGSTDIDDVWLNGLGGALGYLLFQLVAKVSSRRVQATVWALALSACFAVAGYATAYREFGVYLGLATFKEEVHGDEQIPRRPPEAMGIVTGSREDRLDPLGDQSPGGFEPRFDSWSRAERGPGRSRSARRPWHALLRQADVGPGAHADYELCAVHTPNPRRRAEGRTVARVGAVGGRPSPGRRDWTLRPRKVEGRTATPAPAVTTVMAPGALTLPKGEPALFGHTGSKSSMTMPFKGVAGDEVVLYKIRAWQQGEARMAVGTAESGEILRIAQDRVLQAEDSARRQRGVSDDREP